MSTNGAWKLRLYIAGDAPNSVRAMENLEKLCRDFLPSCHDVEVIDILLEPQRALGDSVFLTPTLLRLFPEPVRRIVGTLSETQPILDAFGLKAD
jgi:circadian clock protein KaiB